MPSTDEKALDDTVAEDVQRCIRAYRLKLPRTPLAGPEGRAAGADLGASLDFQDFRSYFPGDDVRHVDWSIYARTDALVVRLYREEVSPDVEVILDCSQSMAVSDQKATAVLGLARLFVALAERERGIVSLVLAGDAPRRIGRADVDRMLRRELLVGGSTLDQVLETGVVGFRKRSIRVVLSDFLFPHDPAGMISRLARNAAALFVVQVLDPAEIEPDFPGGRLLIDVETGEEANMLVDARTITRYRSRLDALSDGLSRQCRLWATPFARLAAGSIASACREVLLPAQIIEAA